MAVSPLIFGLGRIVINIFTILCLVWTFKLYQRVRAKYQLPVSFARTYVHAKGGVLDVRPAMLRWDICLPFLDMHYRDPATGRGRCRTPTDSSSSSRRAAARIAAATA